jgi:hypothetical protein
MCWVGDELVGPLKTAPRWPADNSSPDGTIGEHLRTMLVAYGEMPGGSVLRMMELRDRIEQRARAIDRQRAQGDTK